MLTDTARDLPRSSHYFVHPALSEYIQFHRQSRDFRIVQHVLVGENATWQPFDHIICQIESVLADVDGVALRNRIHDLLANAKSILLSATPRNLRAELETSREWKRVCLELETQGNEEVVLWFEELMGEA
jgi:hypothetical protein